jgi:hypothetical protein
MKEESLKKTEGKLAAMSQQKTRGSLAKEVLRSNLKKSADFFSN